MGAISSIAVLRLLCRPVTVRPAVCRLGLAAGPRTFFLSPAAGLGAGAPGAPGRPAPVHRAVGRVAGLGLSVVPGADQAAMCRGICSW